MKLLPAAVLMTVVILKLVILKDSAYHPLSMSAASHAVAVTLAEYVLFFGCIALIIIVPFPVASLIGTIRRTFGFSHSQSSIQSSHGFYNSTGASVYSQLWKTRLFLCLLFPESFKITALVLHTFDSEPNLLILLQLIILSIQFLSFHSVTGVSRRWLLLAFVAGVWLRLIIKSLCYSRSDLWLLGGFT